MSTLCKSCESEVQGNFCSHCGQYVITERLTIRSILLLTFRKIFDLDNSFWSTVRSLLLEPEKVVNGYLAGATKRYYNPMRFVIIAIAISLLVMSLFGFEEADMSSFGFQEDLDLSEKKKDFQQKYFEWTMRFMNLISLLVIPFFALLTKLLYRKKKLYYAEHLALNSYGIGIATLLGLPITIYAGITDTMLTYGSIGGIAFILFYYIYFMERLWKNGWAMSVVKSLIIVLVGYLLYVVLFGLVSVIIVTSYLMMSQ